jgi:peptide deformylase
LVHRRKNFVAVLPIYLFGQSVLRKKARPVKGVDADLVKFAGDMVETMGKASGIGLAATQVGDLRRVITIDLSAIEETKDQPPTAMINPEILFEEGEFTMEEGCLSLPGLREEVKRPERIRLRYRDINFLEHEIIAEGTLSRVVQHEIDHLDGVLFVDHLSAVKRKLLRGRLNKMVRGEIEADYPVVGPSTADGEHR